LGRGSAVWVASSEDVPGLATESETAEALVEKLKSLIPELLALNGRTDTKPVAFELLTRRFRTRGRDAKFYAGIEATAACRGLPFRAAGKGITKSGNSPVTQVHFVVDSKIKSRHTANAVLKQAGLPKHF